MIFQDRAVALVESRLTRDTLFSTVSSLTDHSSFGARIRSLWLMCGRSHGAETAYDPREGPLARQKPCAPANHLRVDGVTVDPKPSQDRARPRAPRPGAPILGWAQAIATPRSVRRSGPGTASPRKWGAGLPFWVGPCRLTSRDPDAPDKQTIRTREIT